MDTTNEYVYNDITMITMYNAHGQYGYFCFVLPGKIKSMYVGDIKNLTGLRIYEKIGNHCVDAGKLLTNVC